jgi:hypothetical protein
MSVDCEKPCSNGRHGRFRYAMIPIIGFLCLLASLASMAIKPVPTLALDEVVAMKPIEGEAAPVFPKMPIEVLYGVPSERTEHLWPHSKK